MLSEYERARESEVHKHAGDRAAGGGEDRFRRAQRDKGDQQDVGAAVQREADGIGGEEAGLLAVCRPAATAAKGPQPVE